MVSAQIFAYSQPLVRCDRTVIADLPGRAGNKAVLIVDGGCRNHRDGGVVVTLGAGLTCILHCIVEDFRVVHFHGFQGIDDITVLNLCSTVVQALIQYSTEAVLQALVGAILGSGIGRSVFRQANAGQRTVGPDQLIIGSHINFNREAEVHNYSIGDTIDHGHHCKPDGGVAVIARILTFRAIAVCFAVIAGDIGGAGAVALDGPAAAAVAGIGFHGVGNTLTGFLVIHIQLIALFGQLFDQLLCQLMGHDVGRGGVELELFEQSRGNHFRALAKISGGGAACLIADDFTFGVHQIETVVHLGSAPGQFGRNGILGAVFTQIVLVVKNRALVGGVGAGTCRNVITVAIQCVFQVHIVIQCEFLIGDQGSGDVEEGFGFQGDGLAVVSDGLGLGLGGIVVDILALQELAHLHRKGIGCVGSILIEQLLADGHGGAIRNIPIVAAEGDSLQNLLGCSAADNTGDGVIPNLDGGDNALQHSTVRLEDLVGHVQIVLLTHGVQEVGLGSSLGNGAGNGLEYIVQFALIRNIVEIVGLACDAFQNAQDCVLLNVSVTAADTQCDGIHLCTQTGQSTHILLTAGRGLQLDNVFQIGRALTDNGVTLVGITLDSLRHPVTALIAVVKMLPGSNVAGKLIQICRVKCAVQPIIPVNIISMGHEIVILEGTAIRHEDNNQLTVFKALLLIMLLNAVTQLIDGIKGEVVVGTALNTQCSIICPAAAHVHHIHKSIGRQIQRIRHAGSGAVGMGCVRVIVQTFVVGIIVGVTDPAVAIQGIVAIGLVGIVRFAVCLLISIKVGNGNSGFTQNTVFHVFLQGSNQIIDRFMGLGQTGFCLGFATLWAHGAGGIHHDDDINAVDHGHAGSRQFHLCQTGIFKFDTGAFLLHLDGAGVGVLGIIFVQNPQGVAGNRSILVHNRQIFMDTDIFGGNSIATGISQHADSDRNLNNRAVFISNGEDGTGLGACGCTLIYRAVIGGNSS